MELMGALLLSTPNGYSVKAVVNIQKHGRRSGHFQKHAALKRAGAIERVTSYSRTMTNRGRNRFLFHKLYILACSSSFASRRSLPGGCLSGGDDSLINQILIDIDYIMPQNVVDCCSLLTSLSAHRTMTPSHLCYLLVTGTWHLELT